MHAPPMQPHRYHGWPIPPHGPNWGLPSKTLWGNLPPEISGTAPEPADDCKYTRSYPPDNCSKACDESAHTTRRQWKAKYHATNPEWNSPPLRHRFPPAHTPDPPGRIPLPEKRPAEILQKPDGPHDRTACGRLLLNMSHPAPDMPR